MKIDSEKWRETLIDGATALDVHVTAEQAEMMGQHARELILWNRTTNLTAIVDSKEVAIKHYVDAIAPVPLIQNGVRVLDAGSGGGFPGIPLKIMLPDISFTVVDSVRKKISFLKYAIRTLGLENIHAVHGRLEELGKSPQYAGKYDLVVCRAFSSLENFVILAAPFLNPSGRLLAMKGPQAELTDEIPATEEDGTIRLAGQSFFVDVAHYRLPFLDAQRSMVWLIPKLADRG